MKGISQTKFFECCYSSGDLGEFEILCLWEGGNQLLVKYY